MNASAVNIPAAACLPRLETLWQSTPKTESTTCITPAGSAGHAEFRGRVDALAAVLAVDPSRAALLACSDTFHFAIGFCALLRAGREILLPGNLQPDTLAGAVFAGVERIDDAAVARALPAKALPHAAFNPGHAVTLFTSGSTGEPRRVRKRLRQLSSEIDVLEARFGTLIGDAETVATVPHIHIYGLLFRVLWPLAVGRAFHSEAVLGSNLHRARNRVLVSSPAFLRRLEADDLAAAKPRLVFSSGGRLPEDQAAALAQAAGCPLIEVYGSTETGGIAWREWPATDAGWTPFAGVETRIDETSSRLSVRSAPAGDAWLDSGDAATPLAHNRFRLDGRADGVVKIEDKRVSLTAIEEWLEAHEWIAQARVIELPGRRGQLGAVLRLTNDGDRQLATDGRRALARCLREHVRRRFDAVVAPRKWRHVASLPMNAMGKTTVADLARLFHGSAS